MIKKAGVILMLVFWVGIVKAQLSTDLIQFSNDLEDFIKKSGGSTARDAGDEFVGYFNAGRFTNPQKIQIIRICNEMINRHTPMPDFENYLRTVNGMFENNQHKKFDNWQKAAYATFTSGESDEYHDFLQISRNIFAEGIVAQVGGMKWMSSNPNVEMETKGTVGFVFKNINLFCYTQGDTLEIYSTSGKYLPASNSWKGSGGKLDWTRVSIDSATMFAELKSYEIDFATGYLKSDSAWLSYPLLFDKPLLGKLVDRAMAQSQGERSNYPQFVSYQRNFSKLNFGKGKFTGSFAMKGKRINGKGSDTLKAELLFTYKDKPTLKVLANDFVVKNNTVVTNEASVILYLEKDSIFHPQVRFNYRIQDNYINIYRSEEGISMAPFYDSYHNVEFYCDEIKWDLTNPKIDIDMVNDNAPAKFESINYFRDMRYEKQQGILAYNPLNRINSYCLKFNVKEFFVQDYAANFKSNPEDIELQMIDLNDKGFVEYDKKRKYVKVKRKLQDYVNAHNGRTDFDAIAFLSIIKRIPNATISLINNDLQIQGVPKFYFSDSQNVYIIPQDQIITLKKNRAMDFSGKLRSGKVDFYGNGFSFDYVKFQIRLNNVDSMKFLYKDASIGMDMPIRSAIENIYGTLAIDHPNNKSGRKKYPGYPIFKSDIGSKVFYNKPTTQLGVYDKNRFYFDVDPFTMDSLNDLNLEALALSGTFVSGDIVPELKHFLSLQPDKSLGFILESPEAGYPMYRGKGRGFIRLSLSDEGLFGDGEIKYLSSSSKADQFILLLDSMNAQVKTFVNDRTGIYPTVKANQVYEHWMPYNDSMYVYSQQEKISFSADRATLMGTLMLTPELTAAAGNIDVEKAVLNSRNFWLQPDNILSDTAYFRYRSAADSVVFAFVSGATKCNVDLENRISNFDFNLFNLNSNFIYNQYAGSFAQFIWYMDHKKLDFRSYLHAGEEVSYLVSTNAEQDSLLFKTGITTYDVTDYTLRPRKIPYISVGDAKIYADSQKVVIREAADMDILYRAKIIADSANRYHNIENAMLKIGGKFTLNGVGDYEYIDRKKNRQLFYLHEIGISKERHLIAKTNIPDSINFYIGPKILFRGNANLKSIIKNLEYDGFFLTQHTLPIPKTEWFRNAAVVNPDSVFINVAAQTTNLSRQALMVGVNVSNDSTHVYPLFFTRKRNGSDHELMRVEGTLFYDEKTKEFKMGAYNKIFKEATKGNLIVLNEAKQSVSYEGKFDMAFKGSKFEIGAAGSAVYSLADTSFNMKLVALLNFPFAQNALRIMYDSLTDQSLMAAQPEFNPEFLTKALSELVEEKNIKRINEEINENNNIRLINDLEKTIFISDIQLRWNQTTRSFVSVGEIGINSFDKYKFERKIKGMMEIVKRRSGDDFTLYLQSMQGSWYFFKYQKGIMYTIASDPLYNKYVKDNIDKVSKDDFKLRLANISARNQFVKAMKNKQ
jgi:hypothetical protein